MRRSQQEDLDDQSEDEAAIRSNKRLVIEASHSKRVRTAVGAILTALSVMMGPLSFSSRSAWAGEPAVQLALHDGDRVLFYGDSITEQGHYTDSLEAIVRTRFPAWKITFINSGWSGDRAWGGEGGGIEERLHRDVIPHRPTVIAIMLGMNDAYYTDYDPKTAQDFSKNLVRILEILQHDLPQARITLIGASPYDSVTPAPRPDWEEKIDGGYNAVVRRYSETTAEVARTHGLTFVDMNEPLVKLLGEVRRRQPQLVEKVIPDRIHPGPQAGFFMAEHLARGWKLTAPASSVVLDADASARVVAAKQATVTNLVRDGGLRWTQCDAVLPLPVECADPLARLVGECSPELQELTRQTLRVDNLPAVAATLSIDGAAMGDFDRAQWAEGVDLSQLPTPMLRQALDAARLIHIRNRGAFVRRRRLQMPPLSTDSKNLELSVIEMTALENEIDELAAKMLRPVPHRFEVEWPIADAPSDPRNSPR